MYIYNVKECKNIKIYFTMFINHMHYLTVYIFNIKIIHIYVIYYHYISVYSACAHNKPIGIDCKNVHI